ncbi:MAG: orotate phosphoribosyltransferase [Actinomycetia bacterium]|nr:orotate phosphoribosyltransferase [Actinomycetes bacterium]
MLRVISQAEGLDVLKLFKDSGAILEGHFKLTSGYHSEAYMQCASLLKYPDRAALLADAACSMMGKEIDLKSIDTIIAPAVGGILWGYMLADSIGCRMIFTERKDGNMELGRGFDIKKGEKVIIAEDVITTGGSVKEVIKICREMGGDIKAVAVMADRNSGFDPGYPYYNMIKIDMEKYDPDNCPLCKNNIPVIYHGSRKNR